MSSYMTLAQFRKDFSTILNIGANAEEAKDTLMQYLTVRRRVLPRFPSNHICEQLECVRFSKDVPPLYDVIKFKELYYGNFVPSTDIKTSWIKPIQTIGDTWLFDNDHSDGCPHPGTLAELLFTPLEKSEEFFAIKTGKYYYCSDGNHRIYAAYLLGRDVLVNGCEEYRDVFDLNGNKR